MITTQKSPNLVYVFGDTHRWSSMEFTQAPDCPTPNMKAMKEEGISFNNCYSTLPICSPHRAILMTGRWPWEQGFIANHMSLEDRPDNCFKGTLGYLFKDGGYTTHYVGKWHLGKEENASVYGFDSISLWPHEDHVFMEYIAHGENNPFGSGRRDWTEDSRYTGLKDFPYKITGETDQACHLIENHSKQAGDKPLFLMISLQDPHGPYEKDGHSTFPPHLLEYYKDNDPTFPLSDKLRNMKYLKDYYRSIIAVDIELGRIRRTLAESGMAEDTILIYSSDHGGMGGAQEIELGQKRWPHDESSRVPFIVEWPKGITPELRNREIDQLFSSIDIFPTLAGLCRLSTQLSKRKSSSTLAYLKNCPGLDHSGNILDKDTGPDPESIFICHLSNMSNNSFACPVHRTVITKDWMYSHIYPTRRGTRKNGWEDWIEKETREWLLYNRKDDPSQLSNLINEPELENQRDNLKILLDQWLEKTETPFRQTWFRQHPYIDRWKAEQESNH